MRPGIVLQTPHDTRYSRLNQLTTFTSTAAIFSFQNPRMLKGNESKILRCRGEIAARVYLLAHATPIALKIDSHVTDRELVDSEFVKERYEQKQLDRFWVFSFYRVPRRHCLDSLWR
jgi:hypothetical protein